MPGIVGLATRMPRLQAEQELSRMAESMFHQPSYCAGTWIDESLGVYVAWIARKNSFSDGMPLRNEQGDRILIFSGEEYPDAGIASRLRARGHRFHTDSPDYLVHLSEDDALFPAGLNGRFHGLLADGSHGTATLFNDRYGMHRLYYHEGRQAFYFAAEAKAILAVHPELRTADARGLGELVACGCVLENRTVFERIFVLPPASAWLLRDGAVERKATYFQPRDWEEQAPMDSEGYYRELSETFSRVLPKYFSDLEPIGMSLTGGLDTRMIMAWRRPAPGSLPCYSFGSALRETQDVRTARKIARACGQSYEVIPLGPEFLSRFPQYAERSVYLTDGCAGVRSCSDLYGNERAAAIAPVRMTGNYGTEILRRLPAFKPSQPWPGLFHPDFLPNVKLAHETYDRVIRRHAVSYIAFCQAPWHHWGLLGLEQTQLTLRSPFLDNDLVRTAFRAPGSSVAETDIFVGNNECLRLIGDGSPALRRIRTDRGLGGPPGRVFPRLIQSFHEFTFKAEYAYDYGMPQWLARIDRFLSPLHPERLFLGRHKFNHFRIWYRDTLADYVRSMLLDSRTLSRPYLERSGVETVVRGHLGGGKNYTNQIHQLLTVELLHRLFFDVT